MIYGWEGNRRSSNGLQTLRYRLFDIRAQSPQRETSIGYTFLCMVWRFYRLTCSRGQCTGKSIHRTVTMLCITAVDAGEWTAKGLPLCVCVCWRDDVTADAARERSLSPAQQQTFADDLFTPQQAVYTVTSSSTPQCTPAHCRHDAHVRALKNSKISKHVHV